jgi:hypothetical protein
MRAPAVLPAADRHSHAATAAPGDSDRIVHAMTGALARQRPASAAEALRLLRRSYPDIPLAMRIAALCAGSK